MSLLATTSSWAMLGLGVTLMIWVLLRRAWRYQRRARQEPDDSTPRPQRSASRPAADAPPEVLRWQVEMHETARDLKAEIDSKMAALQVFLRMAGEQCGRLEAAVDRAERLGLSPCRDTLSALEQIADGSLDATLPPIEDHSLEQLVRPSQRRTDIYALADAGHNAASIAERVSCTVGEVELILSLRKP